MWVRATAVFTGTRWLEDHTVELRGDVVAAVRPARIGDPAPLRGLLLPGLVNAHTHLELTGAGPVDGPGLTAWVEGLAAATGVRDADAGARMAVAAGTRAVSDVSNTGATVGALRDAGLAGVVQHELLGLDRDRIDARIALALGTGGVWGDVARRPTAHGTYSTAPAVIQAAVRYEGPGDAHPASVHAAEHPDELALLADGSGPFAAFLDRIGRDWRWWASPGCSPVAWLDRLEVLDRVLLVHAVHLTPDDRARIARAGTAVCLCPRSNLHIGGRLPDVPALLDAGIPLCLGTDSLSSCPDLDLLADAAVLRGAFPAIPALTWLGAATSGGARALRFPDHGRIAPGARPGLLWLEGVETPDDALCAPSRQWITGGEA